VLFWPAAAIPPLDLFRERLSASPCFIVFRSEGYRSLWAETYGAVPAFFLVFITVVHFMLLFPYPPASSAAPPSHFTFLHCYSQTSALSYPRTGCYWIISSADWVGLVAQTQSASILIIIKNTTVSLAFCALVCYICK
jgi:hypothetical protein